CDVLVTVRETCGRTWAPSGSTGFHPVAIPGNGGLLKEIRAFAMFRTGSVKLRERFFPWILDDSGVEIRSYQDWWICEKLLRRKRIVFHVIASVEVGLGHVYRALSLAHEITDHELILVCSEDHSLMVNSTAGNDFLVRSFPEPSITEEIIRLKPDLLISDALNTRSCDIRKLKKSGASVVSFEDLGSGTRQADVVINEIYENPSLPGDNILWGHEHFFLRDEFSEAKPHRFRKTIDSLLITFGGADKEDLTSMALMTVLEYCIKSGIMIYIVAGPAYPYGDKLQNLIDTCGYRGIVFTCATGVISGVMEKCQVAISSNGRTVYELAHMNIPSIIVSQHLRESTHRFSCPENGFVNLGVYTKGLTEPLLEREFKKLAGNTRHRRKLFDRVSRFSFSKNKAKVVKLILDLLED
ncbi:MAG: hypothetical protein PHQ23_07725, partial [Candidatus Wallbacteria bacterium]|nr:hypothetical protein [Candidatus Wallbacteria bacterium]